MIITDFSNKKESVIVSGLWQWDYGQVLRIQGLEMDPAEIHFSLTDPEGQAVTRVGLAKDGVIDVVIPDSMLENEGIHTATYMIYAFVYLRGETSGETKRKITIITKTRPKPEFTGGQDQGTLHEMLEQFKGIADNKADNLKIVDRELILLSGEKELSKVTIPEGGGGWKLC